MTNSVERNPQELYGDLYEEQLRIERTWKEYAEERKGAFLLFQVWQGKAANTSIGKGLIDYRWQTVLENVKVFVEHTLTSKRGVKPGYYPLLQQMGEIYTEEKRDKLYVLLAFTAFSSLINQMFVREFRLTNLSAMVGNAVEAEVRLEAYIQSCPDHAGATLKGIAQRVDEFYRHYYADRRMGHAGFSWTGWPVEQRVHLGAKLIELVMDGSGYFEIVNGKGPRGNHVTEVHPTQWLIDTWLKNEENVTSKATTTAPMVIPPAPWKDFTSGGYYGDLKLHSTLLRISMQGDNGFVRRYIQQLKQVDLSEVEAAVNAIQETPWVINKEVLAVAEAILERGGELAGLPRTEPLPEVPNLVGDFSQEDLEENKKKAVKRIKLEIKRKSRALRTVTVVRTAKEFQKYSRIYFPWNMDFRGRMYPIPSFSPQGDDLNRGLLLFADPPECNSMEDIDWMMVQGANCAGVDKVSYEDRRQWVIDNEEHILKSAEDPIGYLWWAKVAEKDYPFQFLAFCFEWKKWKEYEAEHGTAKGFKTGLYVAFDGTCSGLQHFSAILRDPVGGRAVNLLPSEKPQDIYGIVAAKVNEILQKDALRGTPDEERTAEKTGKTYIKFGTKTLAQQWLTYGVTRKVTKRSVMTLAYGSKEYGFRDQLLEDIIDPAVEEGNPAFLEDFIYKNQYAGYLAKLIWQTVQEVVVKAVEGMKWLQGMARLVCKQGRVVTWTTPMGLPVQQSYMAYEVEEFMFRFSGARRKLHIGKPTGNLDKHHQSSGIAPNFIHSMDAAHLQRTVNMSKEAGINHFTMIHDSYGAPVAQAGLMYRTVREAFINMYTEHDVLKDFQKEMMVYIDEQDKLPEMPAKGKLTLKEIEKSEYIFS